MTAALPVEQFTDLARRGQEAATTAVEGWVRALRTYADAVVPRDLRPVDPQVAVAATFTFAEQLLRVQRELVGVAVTLAIEAGRTAGVQASTAGETFAARAEEAAGQVVDLATETTRRAATAARNGIPV